MFDELGDVGKKVYLHIQGKNTKKTWEVTVETDDYIISNRPHELDEKTGTTSVFSAKITFQLDVSLEVLS